MTMTESVESVLAEMRNFGPVTDAQRFAWANRIALAHAREAQDAGRYRWLRSQGTRASEVDRTLYETVHDDCNPPYRAMKHGDGLDAAIDAAIAASQQGAAHEA